MNASAPGSSPSPGPGSVGPPFDPSMLDPSYLAQDRSHEVVVVGVVGIVASTIAVLLRFWSRIVASRIPVWWDDGFMLFTVILSNVFIAFNIHQVSLGLGRHAVALSLDVIVPQVRTTRLALAFYAATIWAIKVSALLLYGRLFRVSDRFVRVLWITGVAVTCWFIFMTIYSWTFCNPIAKSWDPLLPGECWEIRGWLYASALINAALDLIVLLLPMPVIWRLRLSRRKKFAITTAFLFGYCSCFLSFARFIMILAKPDITSITNPDITWEIVPLLCLSMLEGPFAIIALSGPSIHQLASRAVNFGTLSSLFTTRMRGTGEKSNRSDQHSGGFRNLKGSSGKGSGSSGSVVKTWPILDTTASTSSVTAINTEFDNEDVPPPVIYDGRHGELEQRQQQREAPDIPMADLSHGHRPTRYEARENRSMV